MSSHSSKRKESIFSDRKMDFWVELLCCEDLLFNQSFKVSDFYEVNFLNEKEAKKGQSTAKAILFIFGKKTEGFTISDLVDTK